MSYTRSSSSCSSRKNSRGRVKRKLKVAKCSSSNSPAKAGQSGSNFKQIFGKLLIFVLYVACGTLTMYLIVKGYIGFPYIDANKMTGIPLIDYRSGVNISDIIFKCTVLTLAFFILFNQGRGIIVMMLLGFFIGVYNFSMMKLVGSFDLKTTKLIFNEVIGSISYLAAHFLLPLIIIDNNPLFCKK